MSEIVKVRGTYEQWLALARSEQMPMEEFQRRVREDEVFAAWVRKRIEQEAQEQ